MRRKRDTLLRVPQAQEGKEMRWVNLEKIKNIPRYVCNQPSAAERRAGEKLSFMLSKLAQLNYTEAPITEHKRNLAGIYLKNGVLRKKSMDDLTHIAAATLNGCRYIVSWNFRHFVNPKTINAVNAINLTVDLPQIGIVSPSMMLGGF